MTEFKPGDVVMVRYDHPLTHREGFPRAGDTGIVIDDIDGINAYCVHIWSVGRVVAIARVFLEPADGA